MADINQPPPIPEMSPTAPAVPAPRRFSKLAIAGFVLALPTIPLIVALAVGLFHQLMEGPEEEAGPMLLGLFGMSWLGFIGGIFGAVSLRRMRGPEPAYRGRALALISTAGVRATLLATALAFAAVSVGSWIQGGGPGVEFKAVQAGWWIGLLLVGWYVGSMVRRVKRPANNAGWGAFASGLIFHFLLVFAVPTAMASAFFSLHQPNFNGRPQNRVHGASVNGLYATREVLLNLPASPETPVTVRLWENGRTKDIVSLNLSGTVRYRWMLSETPMGGHNLAWSQVRKGGAAESRELDLPPTLDLIPAGDRLNLAVEKGKTEKVWLFLPYDEAAMRRSSNPSPEWAVELVVGNVADAVR